MRGSTAQKGNTWYAVIYEVQDCGLNGVRGLI
jgi:hypothetical protein